jgi:hypothetical protein
VGWTKSYSPSTDDDAWVVKTDADGILEWTRVFGGGDTEQAHCVVPTAEGGYGIAGFTHSYGSGFGDFWLINLAPTVPDFLPPTPDIKADGMDDFVRADWEESVEITFSLDVGTMDGEVMDWWFAVFWYDIYSGVFAPIVVYPIGQYPLVEVEETHVSDLSLDPGMYVCMIIMDDTPDGSFEMGWYDYVVIEWDL